MMISLYVRKLSGSKCTKFAHRHSQAVLTADEASQGISPIWELFFPFSPQKQSLLNSDFRSQRNPPCTWGSIHPCHTNWHDEDQASPQQQAPARTNTEAISV